MKNNILNIKSLWCFIAYSFPTMVFAGGGNRSNIDLGDVGVNWGNFMRGLFFGTSNTFYFLGAVFVLIGLSMATNKEERERNKGKITISILVGIVMLAWPFFADTINNSVFGAGSNSTFLTDPESSTFQ